LERRGNDGQVPSTKMMGDRTNGVIKRLYLREEYIHGGVLGLVGLGGGLGGGGVWGCGGVGGGVCGGVFWGGGGNRRGVSCLKKGFQRGGGETCGFKHFFSLKGKIMRSVQAKDFGMGAFVELAKGASRIWKSEQDWWRPNAHRIPCRNQGKGPVSCIAKRWISLIRWVRRESNVHYCLDCHTWEEKKARPRVAFNSQIKKKNWCWKSVSGK